MTSGAGTGTKGRAAVAGFAAFALILLAAAVVNALSLGHDAADPAARGWRPFAEELTSAAAFLFGVPLVVVTLKAAPPSGRRRPSAVGMHLLASVAFSAVHLLVMIGLREGVWRLLGSDYAFEFNGSELVYEYRKDLLVYGLAALLFWGSERIFARPEVSLPGDRTVELRDGRKLQKLRLDGLVAAEAQGNYVDLVFADGRRRLIRSTLAEVSERLKPYGFVRTHKSWTVAVSAVQAMKPTRAGDRELSLSGGEAAPLSRRYTEALAALGERLSA